MNQDVIIHPGEILKEEFLVPYGLNAHQLATKLDVPSHIINAILHGQRGISVEMSILLGHAFGMSNEFFANLQMHHDLKLARLEATNNPKIADRLHRAGELSKELLARRQIIRHK
jgi:antitoxin HigA-1